MSAAAFERAFARLARVGGASGERLARALVAGAPPWEAWRDALNGLHHRDPAAEVRATRALGPAARAAGQPALAARFLLLEARGLLRSGSPAEAAAVFARAQAALEAVGEPERAAAAAAARVDALGHAGDVRQALRVAARAARRLRGPRQAAGRAFLQVNRGNVLRLGGDLEGARRAYATAARALTRLGDPGNAAIARLNEGVALLEGGQPSRAHATCLEAAGALSALGRSDMALEARYDAACADLRRGRLGPALGELERLASEHEAAGLARRAALCRMDLAEALLRAGDAPEARRAAASAAEAFGRERAPGERAEALLLEGRALAPSAPREAVSVLRRARTAADRAGRAALALRCRIAAAALGGLPGDDALRGARRAAHEAGQHALAHEAALVAAEAALRRGARAAARRHLAPLRSAAGADPWLRARRATLLARLLPRGTGVERALSRLGRACDFLRRVEGVLPGAWLRSRFLEEHADPWLLRIELLLGRGRAGDAARAARLLDELASRRFRAEGRVPRGEPRLVALRARLEALYDRLGRPLPGGPRGGPDVGGLLRARARRLERLLAARWRRLERLGPPRTGRLGAAPAGSALAPGSAALHVWRAGAQVRGLLERPGSTGSAHDLLPLGELSRRLEDLAFLARRAAAPGGADDGALARALAGLGERLLAPLAEGPAPLSLALVLDPSLPDLPFETLPWGGSLLASATLLLRVPALGLRAPRGPVGRGRTVLAVGAPGLAGVAREARGLARGARVHRGRQATRAALSAALRRCAVVHVAGHGYDAPEAPALGGVRLGDGWYGAADLPPRICARLVVLAACRTGRRTGPQALAWGGLPSRLLAGGARHVLWTADDVDDAVSARLSLRLHALLGAGAGVSAAFGRALAEEAAALGHVGSLLPFRLSGYLR